MREVGPRYQTTITMSNVAINDEQDILKNTANQDVVERAIKNDFPNGSRINSKQKVEAILGQVDWFEDGKGFVRCPGADEHSSPTKPKDTVIYLDGAPTISCFHQSCAKEVQQANRSLRRALATGENLDLPKSEMKRRDIARQNRERLELKTRFALPRMLRDYRWPVEEMLKESCLDAAPANHHRLFLECFDEGDIIWVGERYDSGEERHRRHFQTREDWLARSGLPIGPLTCPSTFKEGSYSRSNENVLEQRFLVVESDLLQKNEVGAVFRWLREKVGMKLVAVVDTAGKSLHGWFRYPPKDVLEELRVMLPALKCDPGMFKKAQPARIPSALRDGVHQRLVFLDKEVAQ